MQNDEESVERRRLQSSRTEVPCNTLKIMNSGGADNEIVEDNVYS